MSAHEAQPTPEPLAPRLTNDREPPLNPGAYFIVAFFAGLFSIIYFAVTNASRISQSSALKSRTVAICAAAVVALAAVLVFGPEGWLVPSRNQRLTVRIVAVLASLPLYQMHRGPATARLFGAADGYQSAWKKILPILGLSVLQGIATFIILKARGLV